MRSLFISGSVALLGLLLPEIWHAAFDKLRGQPYWWWIQLGCIAWIIVVALLALPWGRFSTWRSEKIALSFIPGEVPYEEVQTGTTILLVITGARGPDVTTAWTQKVCRVRLHNLTGETFDGMALHLDRFDPPVPTMNDMPLHQMHDNPEGSTKFLRTFPLPPRSYKDVDVVFKNSMHETASLFHVVGNVSQDIYPGRHEIILRAFGRSIEPRYWRFVVVLNAKGELDFRPESSARLERGIGALHSE